MGVVYEAFDRERNTRVALKTIRTLTADTLLRFKNEFRALQDLQHPHLVRLDELFEADGTWFFTMEMVDGVDFTSYVRPGALARPAIADGSVSSASDQRTHSVAAIALDTQPDPALAVGFSATRLPLADVGDTRPTRPVEVGGSPEVARRFPLRTARAARTAAGFDEPRLRHALRQLALGICAIHDAHLVHRDVKPANILVTGEGRVVLLDFGLVTDAVQAQLEAEALGTATYMAPEQLAGAPVTTAADWYAVGVTLYLALTRSSGAGSGPARRRRPHPARARRRLGRR